jgi:hypothetical protein
MDNVLIDDRRIHVDFSQSVAKNYQWNKQGMMLIKKYGTEIKICSFGKQSPYNWYIFPRLRKNQLIG